MTVHRWRDLMAVKFGDMSSYERYIREAVSRHPCPSDGRRKGRRRYGYKKFPSGDRRTKL